MSYPHQDDQPADPFNDAAEALLYSDPETAGQKLRHLMTEVVPNIVNGNARVRGEHARSMATVEKFKQENPDFVNNRLVAAATEGAIYDEQMNDLIGVGFDLADFRKKAGRDPTLGEIANEHLRLRSVGAKVRSADDLVDAAATRVEEQMPGVRRRIHDPVQNAKRRVGDMIADRAKARGKDVQAYRDQYASRQPDYVHSDQPVTPRSIQQATLRDFGEGVSDEQTAARKQRNSDYIASLKNRTQGTDRRSGVAAEVRLNRDASDYRYPDRRVG
jgi:hypothetical protein